MFGKLFGSLRANKGEIYESLLLIPVFSLYATINKHLVSFVETEGPSMQPTFNDSSVTVIDKFFYKYFREVKKGDIIVATSPIDPNTQICKRVIHLPGEVKEIDNGFYTEHFKIPENHVWIEGDNKSNSFDSRNHGPLPIELIQGRVVYCLHPFKSVE